MLVDPVTIPIRIRYLDNWAIKGKLECNSNQAASCELNSLSLTHSFVRPFVGWMVGWLVSCGMDWTGWTYYI